jgi:tetratricopeptide (TPR) repeat protein
MLTLLVMQTLSKNTISQLLLALTLLILSSVSFAVVSAQDCQNVVQNLDTTTDTTLMYQCMDYLFVHNGQDVPVGSFNHVVAIGYRIIQVDPQNEQAYINTAWFLFSKWAAWRHNVQDMPDGEPRMKEALNLLAQGSKTLAGNADFFFDAGELILPEAWYQDAALATQTENYLVQADALLTNKIKKTRTRLDMGHVFRHIGDKANALIWYRKVLEVDSNNAAALKRIKELTGLTDES